MVHPRWHDPKHDDDRYGEKLVAIESNFHDRVMGIRGVEVEMNN